MLGSVESLKVQILLVYKQSAHLGPTCLVVPTVVAIIGVCNLVKSRSLQNYSGAVQDETNSCHLQVLRV